jgi:hypothetical protein
MSTLRDAIDEDMRERRGVDLATAQRMANDGYARRDRVGDQMWQMHHPDWQSRVVETRRGLDR